jgi:hypothetical protein
VAVCGQVSHARVAGEPLGEGVVADHELPHDLFVELHVPAELLVGVP